MAQPALRIDHLRLKNYRCFALCEVELHERLTVLVGDNGRGKSAILQGLATALGVFVDAATGVRQFRRFADGDVRVIPDADGKMVPQLPTTCTATGFAGGEPAQWIVARVHDGERRRTHRQVSQALRFEGSGFRGAIGRDGLNPLPVVAYYGTGRLYSQSRSALKDPQELDDISPRLRAYLDCLAPLASFARLEEWFEKRVSEVRTTPSVGLRDEHRPEILLAAVEAATRTVLEPTRWTALDWDRDQRCLVATNPDRVRIPLSSLSDGVRSMIALVCDLAQRCVRLNPHLGVNAARDTPGVVLIDEVDLHLHPNWQQLVVGLLQRAFPNLQMVLTTHSPQVLSTVNRESIRLINVIDGIGQIDPPRFQTRGVQSADVLAKVMYVDPVPPAVPEAVWLSDYRALVQSGKHEQAEALELWGRLVNHFGADHPLIEELIVLRQFQEFKSKHHIQ